MPPRTSVPEPPSDSQYVLERPGQRAVVTEVYLALGDGRVDDAVLELPARTRKPVHVCTADTLAEPARRRRGIAIEPMPCAPDAFNSGDGLLALAPGASFAGCWGLTTQREEQ